jgi:hypothetical protein
MVSSAGPRRPVTSFPTSEESLALQASLLDGDPARQAWRQLASVASPDQRGIAWIAPLLMENLKRLIPDDPWVRGNPHFLTLAELKGRAVTRAAEDILICLSDAAVPTMALKGLALGASIYRSPGLRTISDLDILVPGRDLFRAMEALKRHGLRSAAGEPVGPGDLRANHAHVFSPPKRHDPTLDLHWHVLSSARGEDDDAYFWSAARPLRVGSAETLGLCLEDQLLHVLVHGVRWTRMPHVRWVADATLLLRQAGEGFKVERFLDAVQRFDVVVPVQEGLAFVAGIGGEGRELLDRVSTLARSRFSERAFRARATAYEDRSVADRIALRIETAVWSHRARRRATRPGDTSD